MPTADLQLCKDFVKYNTMDIFTYADLGESMEAKHKVVFRRDKDMDKNGFYYAQTHLKDSALIAWPLHRRTFMKGKTTIVYFEPSTYNNDITLISILGYQGQ